MKIAPDAEARARALVPDGSFIVQAPAGSGKTELLIQRYLTLLPRVDQPEAVLAITFTRKAAGEMRRRVWDALRAAAHEPRPEEPHKALTWTLARAVLEADGAGQWGLLDNPSRLRMRTIDSVCASLVRQMPWLSRMGAVPDIVEDARALYREAAGRTVSLLESDRFSAPVERLLWHLDNDTGKLASLLAEMLARRDQWLRLTGAGGAHPDYRQELEAALQNVIRDALRRVRDAVPETVTSDIAELAAYAARNLAASRPDSPIAACAGLRTLPGCEPADLQAWAGIAALLLTRGKWRQRLDVRNGFPADQRSRPMKRRIEQLLSALAREDRFRSALDELCGLPEPRYSDAQWDVLQRLFELLPLAAAQLKLLFGERGQADYIEIALGALDALGPEEAPTDIALAQDDRIRHLLVDEFQDTSLTQYELLKRLTAGWQQGDGRTLFVVGDPMQSIYRFRQAEVGLFLRAAQHGIGNIRLEPVRLTANFRSAPSLVEWVNAAFPAVLPETEDIPAGAIPFSASTPACAPARADSVCVHAFLEGEEEDEAARVVEIVAGEKSRDPQAKIAILVRARNHLPATLSALRAAGLQYRAVEIDPLGELPVIQDLLALTRALRHAADRIAWLAVLRAPWCGLSLADLHALAADDHGSPIWNLIQEDARAGKLSADGSRRVAKSRAVLAVALEARGRIPLRELVERTWIELGGPACLRAEHEISCASAYFELLEEVDAEGPAAIDGLQARLVDLFAPVNRSADDSLQVMTIHKAKGLEFDVVIVPALGRRGAADPARLLLWLERPSDRAEHELILGPIAETGGENDRIYDYLRGAERQKSAYENGRLLYVAATRARNSLHLLGTVRPKDNDGFPEVAPSSNTLLADLWPVVRETFEERLRNAGSGVTEQPAQLRRGGVLRRLPLEWRIPDAPEPVAVPEQAPGDQVQLEEPEAVTFDWAGETVRHVGTVVHRLLRRIASEGAACWTPASVREQRPLYRVALAGLGVSPADLDIAAAEVERALLLTLADERGRWILDRTHSELASELPVTGVVDGAIVSGVIDRTFIDARGTRWIVDFKTSTHQGGDREAFLDNERERYRRQMERYALLLGRANGHPVRLGLYFPLLGSWREWIATTVNDFGPRPFLGPRLGLLPSS